jgi:dephospho-CoA kinase
MLKVGLTGSIATGKTTVLARIAALGIPVFSADEAVHRLYAGRAAAPIEQLFPGVVTGGVVDRNKLSAELLRTPARLAELEALVHPLVREEVAAFFAAAERGGATIAVVDVPLLFERGFDYGLDVIIVTAVDEAIQRARALARPGMSEAKLAAILARQLPQAEKKVRADHVIDTSGSLESTASAITALIEKLQADPRAA